MESKQSEIDARDVQIEKEKELILLRHKLKMEELVYDRETNKLFHDRELERIRIKSAEIRRQFERKQNEHFAKIYPEK